MIAVANVFIVIMVFLLLLSFLVIIHEAGHFFAARLFGIKVYEFGLGYPPRAKHLFNWLGCEFTLNWIPFGGFVKLAGEERPVNGGDGLRETEKFYTKPLWQKLVVILAGAGMNFVFGVAAFSVMFAMIGIPTMSGIIISEVMENTPAEKAGLEREMHIRTIVYGEEKIELGDIDDFVREVGKFQGKSVSLEVEKGDVKTSKEVYVRLLSEIPEGEGALGVAIVPEKFEFVKYSWWQMPFRGAWYGIKEAVRFGLEIIKAVGMMVGDLVQLGKIPSDVGGPVRIVYEAHKADLLSEGFLAVLNFAAILSINLAMVNILPFPALDGGRALFLGLERMLGNKFKPAYEQYGNAVGMILLLLLIISISFRDVGMIFTDNGIGWSSVSGWLGR